MAELLQGGFTDLRNQNSLALVKHSSDSNLYINFFKYSGIKSMVPNNFSRQISTAGEEETTPQLFLSFFPFLSHSNNIISSHNPFHISILHRSFIPCHFNMWVFSMTWELQRSRKTLPAWFSLFS